MKKILYIILGICYCLLFGEIFVRIFTPVALMPRYVTAAPYGVRMNVPNAQYWQTTPEVQVQVRINAQGIRSDREYSYQKPENRCRVLLFGDSFFMGYEVDLKDSLAYLLEQRLNVEGYPCEVINLAVSGFGTAEMLIALQNEGFKYQPDVVVFQWHQTDPRDNVRSKLFKLDAKEQLIKANKIYLPAIKIRDWLSQFAVYRFLIENSQLYSAIREMAAKQVKSILVSSRAIAVPKTPSPKKSSNRKSNYPMRLSTHLLQQAEFLSREQGANFCILEIPDRPSRTEFRSNLAKFEPKVRQQLNMWSPIQVFQQAADPSIKIYFEKGHFHLTPLGNQLLTEYFFSKLKATGWLEKFRRSIIPKNGN